MANLEHQQFLWDQRSLFKHDARYFGLLNANFIYAKELTLEMVLHLHREIMWTTNPLIAGDLRTTDVGVREHVAVPWEEVTAKMSEFVEWFNLQQHTTTIHSLTAEVHYRLTYIHPFFDGNGRCARLLSNFVLARKGFNPVIFDANMRSEYNDALTNFTNN